MSKNELISRIEALNEWEALMEEARSEAEAIRDSIKAEMMERDTEELTAGRLRDLLQRGIETRLSEQEAERVHQHRY